MNDILRILTTVRAPFIPFTYRLRVLFVAAVVFFTLTSQNSALRKNYSKFDYRTKSVVNAVHSSKVEQKKAFAAAKAEPTFRGTLLKKSIKMKGE